MTLRGYDHWKTTEPDDGWRLVECPTCYGMGTLFSIDQAWECPACNGEGRIVEKP